MMLPAVVENVARAGAGGLADSLLEGFAIALLAWALVSLLRKHSAAMRAAVWMAALGSLVLLPVLRNALAGHAGAVGSALFEIGGSWALTILAVWAIVAFGALARIAVGIWKVRALRRSAQPFAMSADLQPAMREFCPSRRVQLLLSDTISVPSAVGFFRPAVVLPAWLPKELSAAELRHVIIHELSHLRRRDDWSNLLQQIVKALFFFHPAVWWIEDRLSLEREMACDDVVLASSDSPRAYAECLAHLAEKSFLRRGLAMAQAAVSHVRQTTQRVARILAFDRSARTARGKLGVSMATLLAIGCYGAMLHAPELVSFNDAGVTVADATTVAASWSRPVVARHDAPAPRAINATLRTPAAAPVETKHAISMQTTAPNIHSAAKPQPGPRVVQAMCGIRCPQPGQPRVTTFDSAHVVTLIFVMQDQDTISVWRISTWTYVPSRQLRADHKTT